MGNTSSGSATGDNNNESPYEAILLQKLEECLFDEKLLNLIGPPTEFQTESMICSGGADGHANIIPNITAASNDQANTNGMYIIMYGLCMYVCGVVINCCISFMNVQQKGRIRQKVNLHQSMLKLVIECLLLVNDLTLMIATCLQEIDSKVVAQ